MPVFLEKHDGIHFVAAKTFTYGGEVYQIGSDFPDHLANNAETLVRARFIIPVIEDDDQRPRHWYRHIQKKSLVLDKLGVGSHLLNKPERVPEVEVESPEPEVEAQGAPDATDDDSPEDEHEGLDEVEDSGSGEAEEFDPADYTIPEVLAYLEEHPDEHDRIVELELAGRHRTTLLAQLGADDE